MARLMPLFPSTSNKTESIKLLNEMVAIDGNRFRGILVHPRCHHLILEMSSWTLKDGQPVKMFDHGCDALRYLAWNSQHGLSVGGALGLKIDNPEILDRIEREMSRIDTLMDRIDARIGVNAFDS